MTAKTTIVDGKEVYDRIKPTLELKFPGQYVVIEPVSKEYFIDPSMGIALKNAKARYPTAEFYTTRIGQDAAMTMMR